LVLYTGTHDNDTSRGWYESSDEEVRGNFRSYLSVSGEDVPWDLLRAAYRSVSNLCVVPMQDILSLGSQARLNRPGHAFGNWSWRMTDEQLTSLSGETATYLREQAKASGRLPLGDKE
jgi:4-alpha-glucanotransferase